MIDHVLTELSAIEGQHGKPFVIRMLHNDFRILHSGVEIFQISRLADGVTSSIVSHGNTTSGVIDVNGIFKVKGRQVEGCFESSTTSADNVTTEIDTGIPNTKVSAKVYLHVETPSQDSFIEIDVIKQGNNYIAVMGWQTGTEFTQLSVVYNQTKSNQLGTHYIDIVGTGNGAAMTYNVKTESNFK